MGKIIRNLMYHWRTVILIVALLFIQAMCDLSLPNFTSNIIDVGIQNSGVQYATPIMLTTQEYDKISEVMTDDEAALLQSSYNLGDDGYYHLKDSSDNNLEKLDESFTVPLVVVYMLSMADQQTTLQLPPSQSVLQQSSPADANEVRELVEAQLSVMGSSLLHSSAVAYTKAQYQAIGLDTAKMQSSYLWTTGGRMLAVSLLMTLTAILVGFFSSRVGAKIGRDLREKVFNKVVSFSDAEINKFSTASLITRSTNDIQQIQMVCTMLLRMVFYAPIMAIGGIIMVVRTDAGMEWIIVMAVIVLFCIVGLLMAIAMPKFKLMQTLIDRVNLVSREILTGLSVIRAFGREKTEEQRFDKANVDLTGTMLFTNRVMTFMMPAMMLLMNGITVLIVWVAGGKIDAGVMEVGTMTAFITYTIMIVFSFLIITAVSIFLPRAAVAANRIEEVITTQATVRDKEKCIEVSGVKGVIKYNNVSFKYPGADDYVLKDISFTALPGHTTAIIGSTGCGKTTLVNLLLRFYDVTEGSVTIDGVDIRDLAQKNLRDLIGYVPQKGVLFSGTIATNLRYGSPQASDEEIAVAAEIAHATEFINEKQDKYDSSIAQGGSNVSGGQKQRLSIARAIAKNPNIYIFDDSFSALDYKTDVSLRRALSEKAKDSTVIIVAQRISTIMFAEQILVLDEGKLAGAGTHKQLLRDCDVYRQIAASQLSERELADQYSGKEDAADE